MLKLGKWFAIAGAGALCLVEASADCVVYCPPQFSGCGSYVNAGGACNEYTIKVTQAEGSLCVDDICITYGTTGWEIVIGLDSEAAGDYRFDIVGSGSPAPDIESISVEGPDEAYVSLIFSGVRDVSEVTRSDGGELFLSGTIGRDLLGPVTASGVGIVPNQLSSLIVSRHLTDDITLFVPTTSGTGGGDVRVVMVVLGNLVGDVEVPLGAISEITVGGSVGAASAPIAIRAELDIGSIEAGEIHADIEAGWDGPASNIRSITTTADNSFSGNFTGSMTANTIGAALNYDDEELEGLPAVSIVGDLGEDGYPATVEFTGGLDTPDARYFRVGGSFVDGSTITLPTGGLEDQIIFNAANDSGVWESGAEIEVGASTLTNASYATLPSTLGGGAAGLAPFDLHGLACSPVDGASVVGKGPDPECSNEPPCCFIFNAPVKVRLYGPVEIDNSLNPWVILENYVGPGPDDYEDVTWGFSTVFGVDLTELVITRNSGLTWPTGQYRIRPIPGQTKCAGVDGTPDVAEFVYNFTLYDDCNQESFAAMFDQNNDGFMTSADMTAWANNPVDLNGDNLVNTDDLYRLTQIVALFN